jgi:hypothetical protein
MPDVILHSGPSKAYPPLAAWIGRFCTESYEGPIMVFKSGGDRYPIQRAHINIDDTFSWRFPDGREETFVWKWSKLPEVRDVNEERHGTGWKCVKNKTGKIVAATMESGFRKRTEGTNWRMAFFRWNMSNDMGDDFECMLVMSRIVGDTLFWNYAMANRDVSHHVG